VNPADVGRLKDIAEVEFPDIVEEAIVPFANELRIILKDGSFVDVWFSLKLMDRYSYHWERRGIDRRIFRHDNAPHKSWQFVATFPKHFHDGSEDIVSESRISNAPDEALREFLSFVRGKMTA
jgi:hypothetical protein